MTAQDRKREQRHVMVVDQDAQLLSELSHSLRAAGHRVTSVANADNTLDLAEQDTPDLAVLDMRIPGMAGVRLGRVLRERSGVPFLCLSDPVDRETARHAAEHGALGYLVKPLAVQQMMPSIEAALARGSDICRLRENESQLNSALAGTRAISMAVGLLMMRDRINRVQALELLRSSAQTQRRPIADLASELLSSVENIYKINNINEDRSSRQRVAVDI